MSKQLTFSSILAIIAMGGFAMLAQASLNADATQFAAHESTVEAGFGS